MTPITIRAKLSDGKSASTRDVLVTLARAVEIREAPDSEPKRWAFHRLVTGVPLTKKSRDVLLRSLDHEGETLFVAEPGFAAMLLQSAPQLSTHSERWRYLRPGLAVAGVALAIAGLVYLFDLSPAKTLAQMLPASAREMIGTHAIASFTEGRAVCENTAGKQALDRLVDRLASVSGSPDPFRVRVVDWDMVNAFALPGGHIALNRGLIEKATSPDEVAGVLAHEMGHAIELHPEAGIIRAIGISAALELMFSGSSGTLTNLGAMLVQLRYNRGAESDADDHALRILKAANISPKPLSGFFRRLTEEFGGPTADDTKSSSAADLFATHPPSPERAKKAEEAASYDGIPALTDTEWRHLKDICLKQT